MPDKQGSERFQALPESPGYESPAPLVWAGRATRGEEARVLGRNPDGTFQVTLNGVEKTFKEPQVAAMTGMNKVRLYAHLGEATQSGLTRAGRRSGPPIWEGRAKHGEDAKVLGRNPDGTFQVTLNGVEKTFKESQVAAMTGMNKVRLYKHLGDATRAGLAQAGTKTLNYRDRLNSGLENTFRDNQGPDSPTKLSQSTISKEQHPKTIGEALKALDPLVKVHTSLLTEWESLAKERTLALSKLAPPQAIAPRASEAAAPKAPPRLSSSNDGELVVSLQEEAKHQIFQITQRQTQIESQLSSIISQARSILAVPAGEQGVVKISNWRWLNVSNPRLAKLAKAGANLVQQYVHPSLMPELSFEETSAHRAGYDSISKIIYINTNATSPSLVAHEITHGIELQESTALINGLPVVRRPLREKAHSFLMKRAGNEQPKKLGVLDSKNKDRYDDHEFAYEDTWKEKGGDPYSGKYYSDGSTEILTVGIQRLHDDPVLFMTTDPEYFQFIVSNLRYNIP